ncbi:MAG: biotin--[acetyl-CoA-carboxylase] ligase [Ferruginibacter sp.]
MKSKELFSILDSVDSTNNYAMAMLHEGLAIHGQAWFSALQTEGKGQREKKWYSRPGENIALSIALLPGSLFQGKQFLFNAFISLQCYNFLKPFIGDNIKIKWPNDIYWRDRKAGGILIENKMKARKWEWAVVGIGLNINQESFPPELPNPVSLKQITGSTENILSIAMNLHSSILSAFEALDPAKLEKLMNEYNEALYKKNEAVKLRKENIVFSTTVKSVNPFGQLLTQDAIERKFDFGEVEWVIG